MITFMKTFALFKYKQGIILSNMLAHLGEIYRNKWTKLVKKVYFLDVFLPLV